MLRLAKPSQEELHRTLDVSTRAGFTYAEVGATLTHEMPAGFRLDHYELRLGTGEGLFERAVAALRGWQAQRGAGIDVYPPDAHVAGGGTVLFVLRAFGLWTISPCRVVEVKEEPALFAFAYGTLPGHPERGEVAMTVACDANGAVTARIDSFSRTIDPLARAVSPMTRILQKRITHRYLEALSESSGAV
jgi:uncharacterized protein (UPF0548 family)